MHENDFVILTSFRVNHSQILSRLPVKFILRSNAYVSLGAIQDLDFTKVQLQHAIEMNNSSVMLSIKIINRYIYSIKFMFITYEYYIMLVEMDLPGMIKMW